MERKLLRTDYKDAVFEGLRKYRKIDNGDGTVSFVDVTDYTVKEGSFFGAEDANAINEALNAVIKNELLDVVYNHNKNTAGFLKLATLKVTGNYISGPISFDIVYRGAISSVFIKFNGTSLDGTDIIEFSYSGDKSAYLHKSDTTVWDLYIPIKAWDFVGIKNLRMTEFDMRLLDNGNGITWNTDYSDFAENRPSGSIEATLMTSNIKPEALKNLEERIGNYPIGKATITESINDLEYRTALMNFVKQVEVSFNNSVSSSIMTNSFLAGSALDINEINIQGIICTGIGAMLDACFSTDKSQILFYLNNNSGYTGTLKANIILLYSDGTLVTPDDPISGGEIPV